MNIRYPLIQRRIDVVTRVPAWAVDYFSTGDLVIREDPDTVIFDNKRYKLGESYTRFKGYEN